ncbi:hypothetical protein [Ruegeria atlantica]|uniref:Uncharacterized protein n=1 Tax=Ruegeria atlantica TaxID=81569 RepID=A0A0P1E9A6_9RHOB|nr:hypothetical protein [Ruegeria atlantica]CUH45531.1 hypothetical protein RUM4293_04447 [Ruegeria atlantica]
MPRVIAMHDVDDVEHWLSSQQREDIFKDVAFDMVTFVHPTEPNKVGLSANIPDLDKFLEINNGPIGQAAMKHDGIQADTIAVMIEA